MFISRALALYHKDDENAFAERQSFTGIKARTDPPVFVFEYVLRAKCWSVGLQSK